MFWWQLIDLTRVIKGCPAAGEFLGTLFIPRLPPGLAPGKRQCPGPERRHRCCGLDNSTAVSRKDTRELAPVGSFFKKEEESR